MELHNVQTFFAQILLLSLCTLGHPTSPDVNHITASCNVAVNTALSAGINDAVSGTVVLTQESNMNTTIYISLTGFDTADSYTKHGFHIHASNNLSSGCNSLGGHYNPQSVNHGAPNAAVRHVGDLGNIEESAQGEVKINITDHIVMLSGDNSVLNRSIVIHQKEDDLGLGGDAGSIATGNAGSRLACCIITEVTSNDSVRVGWSISLVLLALSLSLTKSFIM